MNKYHEHFRDKAFLKASIKVRRHVGHFCGHRHKQRCSLMK